jgi:hypothetical protein
MEGLFCTVLRGHCALALSDPLVQLGGQGDDHRDAKHTHYAPNPGDIVLQHHEKNHGNQDDGGHFVEQAIGQ